MPVDIYEQKLCEPLCHRLKREPFTKNRQAELQASYYQRRGWFLNKKRMLFKRIRLDAKLYSHIESMDELDAFCKQYLMDKYHLDIPERPTIFLMKCVKPVTKEQIPNEPNEAKPLDAVPDTNEAEANVQPKTTAI
jgi:hypothetical protein